MSRLLVARLLVAFFILVWFIDPGVPVRSQQPIPGATGDKRLDADQLKGDEKTTFDKLRDGNIDWQAAHQPLLEKAARWYVNRVTYVEYQKKAFDATSSMTVNDIIADAYRQIPEVKKQANKQVERDRQKKYLLEFGKALTAAIDEVLKNPMPIARVNAARILARLGEAGQEESADYMLKVLEDKDQIDAVKLYALRGLKELLAALGRLKDADREAKVLQGLIEFIKRPATFPKGTAADEVEAFRYVRREAIRALAQGRVPAVVQKKEIVAMPALELLRVLSKDGITPEPSLSEQFEAALGLCKMQSKLHKDYQPDYVAQHLGYFLNDFMTRYNDDRTKPIRSDAWKIQAVRLQQALDELRDDKKEDIYVASLVTRAKSQLSKIEADNVSQPNTVGDWVKKTAPKGTSLFKGDDKSTVKLPTPPEN